MTGVQTCALPISARLFQDYQDRTYDCLRHPFVFGIDEGRIAPRFLGTGDGKTAKLILGVLIIFLLLCQLFTFEKFPEILSGVGTNSSMSLVVMIVLVITELVSLPFLIGMEISRLVVLISRAAGFISLGLMTNYLRF